ncbi:hypothetical protein JA1_005420 [Spathaspora sp. JA1]|nr:hypothetical protein JA1_005420 [Spathaspora sp. JA1]
MSTSTNNKDANMLLSSSTQQGLENKMFTMSDSSSSTSSESSQKQDYVPRHAQILPHLRHTRGSHNLDVFHNDESPQIIKDIVKIEDPKNHRFVKKTLNELSFTPVVCHNSISMNNSITSSTSSSSDIFERSLETNNSRTFITNPETPSHYNLENYTSPILDTTTEILTNPKIKLDQVKLNYFCDDDEYIEIDPNDTGEDTEQQEVEEEVYLVKEPQPQSFRTSSVSSYSSHTPSNASLNSSQMPTDTIETTMSSTERPVRPRARSIISQTLISTLENSKSRMTKSASTIQPSGYRRRSHSIIPKLNKRSLSFSGATKHSRSQSKEDPNSPSIEFYSFADMITHEDLYCPDEEEEEEVEGFISPTLRRANTTAGFHSISTDGMECPFRKSSYTTISAKDYIGVL